LLGREYHWADSRITWNLRFTFIASICQLFSLGHSAKKFFVLESALVLQMAAVIPLFISPEHPESAARITLPPRFPALMR
jgi:hypothetical protein